MLLDDRVALSESLFTDWGCPSGTAFYKYRPACDHPGCLSVECGVHRTDLLHSPRTQGSTSTVPTMYS